MSTVPFFFRTGTMPAHHSVGSLVWEITPNQTILSSSSLTVFRSAIGTLLGVESEKGLAPSFNQMMYVSQDL